MADQDPKGDDPKKKPDSLTKTEPGAPTENENVSEVPPELVKLLASAVELGAVAIRENAHSEREAAAARERMYYEYLKVALEQTRAQADHLDKERRLTLVRQVLGLAATFGGIYLFNAIGHPEYTWPFISVVIALFADKLKGFFGGKASGPQPPAGGPPPHS